LLVTTGSSYTFRKILVAKVEKALFGCSHSETGEHFFRTRVYQRAPARKNDVEKDFPNKTERK
jgi:hypothetical protein